MQTIALATFIILIAILNSGCSSEDLANPAPDTIDNDTQPNRFFDPNQVLRYDITLSDADWDALRNEGRQISLLANQCPTFVDYTFFSANLTIDGQTMENVPIRKKGSLGSLSRFRPSFRISVGRGPENEGRTFDGQRRFTLNNNFQDPSDIEQCLAYSVFTAAGLPAPRCNFAEVTAQGDFLGTYTHVESIKKPFLRRVFGNDSGNLYEGQGSDFSENMKDSFQLKTNEELNDRSDLDLVIQALAVPDAQLWDSLNNVIDMEQFLSFIAVEALTGHSDSYSGLQNNFFIYHNPDDDRFHFIPWGPDQSFQSLHISGSVVTNSIYLASVINQRIWQVPALRARYDTRMRELLATAWDETTLLAEADRMAALINADPSQVNIVKSFIRSRRAAIEAELGTNRVWPLPLSTGGSASCVDLPEITGSFDSTWNSNIANFSFTFPLNGIDTTITNAVGSSFFVGSNGGDPRLTLLFMRGDDSVSGRSFQVIINMPNQAFSLGEMPFHGFETVGFLFEVTPNPTQPTIFAFIGDGSITFDNVSRTPGETVSGSWQAKFILP